jgi:hypothetical protein
MKIDPLKSLEKVDAAIAADPSPRHRAMLENFREHLLAELDGDVERIMKTQVDEPRYQFWGSGIGDFGPKGGEQVRAFYRNIFEKGYNKLYYEIDRIFCGDDHLFHDGTLHMVWPGRALREIGVAVDDPDASYLYSYRQAAIFKYDAEGLCTGEDTYSDGHPTLERVRKLAPDELPGPLRHARG